MGIVVPPVGAALTARIGLVCVVSLGKLILYYYFPQSVIPVLNKEVGAHVTLTETPRKAAIQSSLQYGREARQLEGLLETQTHLSSMLAINPDAYTAVTWDTTRFSRPFNEWWCNRNTMPCVRYLAHFRHSCYIDSQDVPATEHPSHCKQIVYRRAGSGHATTYCNIRIKYM
jgi:hypothetical protein